MDRPDLVDDQRREIQRVQCRQPTVQLPPQTFRLEIQPRRPCQMMFDALDPTDFVLAERAMAHGAEHAYKNGMLVHIAHTSTEQIAHAGRNQEIVEELAAAYESFVPVFVAQNPLAHAGACRDRLPWIDGSIVAGIIRIDLFDVLPFMSRPQHDRAGDPSAVPFQEVQMPDLRVHHPQ
ncbi:hypothetical protein [Methylococcus sp. Mc7]|uniref:hypothetical protein n=1 Tax=Methylococcus sp. Mc7 TaxID=2860258 RepID=UPI001C52B24E|nr:hypothetical protein KW115_02860 [Methylococcus sp. Mc7]